jgi:hypothetical protein
VCHGCRSATYELDGEDDRIQRLRPVQLPGDGTITRHVAATPTTSGSAYVSRPCPVCGGNEDAEDEFGDGDEGWTAGFIPPA